MTSFVCVTVSFFFECTPCSFFFSSSKKYRMTWCAIWFKSRFKWYVMAFPQMVPLFNEKHFVIYIFCCCVLIFWISCFDLDCCVNIFVHNFHVWLHFDGWSAVLPTQFNKSNSIHLLDQITQTKLNKVNTARKKTAGILPITIDNRHHLRALFLSFSHFYLSFEFVLSPTQSLEFLFLFRFYQMTFPCVRLSHSICHIILTILRWPAAQQQKHKQYCWNVTKEKKNGEKEGKNVNIYQMNIRMKPTKTMIQRRNFSEFAIVFFTWILTMRTPNWNLSSKETETNAFLLSLPF